MTQAVHGSSMTAAQRPTSALSFLELEVEPLPDLKELVEHVGFNASTPQLILNVVSVLPFLSTQISSP